MKSENQEKLYLQTDTHWTPEAMHQVATELGSFLEKKCGLPPTTSAGFAMRAKQISSLGDIAEMLKLPASQTVFPKQSVTITKIVAADGSPWQPDHHGEVMLLGDSFANIYSLEGMGWGTGAGFAEHLSYSIGRAVDKIVMNSGGSFATRRDLASQMARGVDRLAGKKIVVYEFSMRDLAQGDWKMIKLPQVPRAEVVPPVQVKTLPGTKPLTAFKTLVVTPETLDLSRHDKVKISVPAPPGNGSISIVAADGKVVRRLAGTAATVDYSLNDTWNGTDVHGKPVPVGTYTVRVEGARPDHSALEPVTHTLVVVDGKQTAPVVVPTQPGDGKTGPKPVTPGDGSKPPKPITPTNTTQVRPAEQGMFATGRIAARATTPKPGSVPYKDCLIALDLTDLKVTGGTVKGQHIIVYVWGMRDNTLVDGAYNVGQTIRFKLSPWASVESKYGGYNRQELDSDESLSWEAFWGEISK